MKRILSIIVLALLSGYILFAAIVFCRKPAGQVCQGVRLEIRDSLGTGYMSSKDVTDLLTKSNLDPTGRPLDEVSLSAIEKTFPGLAASPYVMTGATDCCFYQEICENCIRFAPVIYGPEQMKGMHGIDENIEANCLPGAVDFYKTLIGLC